MIKSSPSVDNAKSVKKRITIGRVGAPQGIKGEMRIIPLTDFPDRFFQLKKVMVGDELLHIDSCRYHKQFIILKFHEYPVREDAMALTGRLLTIAREDAVPLEEGEFYIFDIIGLTVFDDLGHNLGCIENVLRTGANDVYEIHATNGKSILIPALKSVVKKIDLAAGRMTVVMPEVLSDAH